jgi:uncharacterized protein involved in propanediol utilization
VLPKAHLNLVLALHQRYRTLGVVVAHSGTYVGLLLDPAAKTYPSVLPTIVAELACHSSRVNLFHTVDFQKVSWDDAL